jgi:hypothetical protein
MPIGYFLDKTHQATIGEMETVMGSAYPLWQRLVHFIAEKYQLQADLSFGGKNYGWNLWYRKSGKSLVSLYPQSASLIAQVVLGREQVEQALTLPLGEKVARMVKETPQLHDGKWLFIPVTTEQDASDVEQLLLLKKRPVNSP